MGKTAVVAITKHGIQIARGIKQNMPDVEIYVPAKHSDLGQDIHWFTEQTTELIANLFRGCDALICIFSLGAVIRMISPHLVDKKSDPAVVVIDDKAKYVVSALSGHLGGANALARYLASFLKSEAVITTAADVNETIAVDLLGRQFGWVIENFENVTRVSAMMVNEETIAVYQEVGEKDWWAGALPKNVSPVHSPDQLKLPEFKAALVITDLMITDPEIIGKSVIYRPKDLVVGVGLHWDTTSEEVETGINTVFKEYGLSVKSIRNIASISRGAEVKGLLEFSKKQDIPVKLYEKESLATIIVPNPSETVQKFEGTPSVSEAASLLSSEGELIVPKQKFPPNLTVAVSRIQHR